MESEQITASTFGNHKNQFCKSFRPQTAGEEGASLPRAIPEKSLGSRKSFPIEENEDIKRKFFLLPSSRYSFRFHFPN
jgi:hypothetical protein